MSDGILSQDEIDALLGTAEGGGPNEELDVDALAEIVRLATESSIEGLGDLLKASLSARFVASNVGPISDLIDRDKGPQVTVTAKLSGDVQGGVCYLLAESTAAGIGAMVLGQASREGVLNDEFTSGLSKAMDELGAQFATTVSAILAAKVDAEVGMPVKLDPKGAGDQAFPIGLGDNAFRCSFILSIERDNFDLEVLVPIDTATSLLRALSDQLEDEAVPVSAPPQPAKAQNEQPRPMPIGATQNRAKTHVSAFEPSSFGQGVRGADPGNLEFLLDVPLEVTVELGRTRMQIRDVLDLGKGSVIELDKLAGELVEIFVNGKLIAKGEVVTIDENFGVKITDIVSRRERVNNLQ